MTSTKGQMVRHAFSTVVRGFLLGLGFSAGVALISVVAYRISASVNHDSPMFAEGMPGEPSLKSVVLSDVEEMKHGELVSIVGSAKNSGSRPLRGVQIRANLFKQGKFVDQYSTSLSGTLEPGGSQYFKITCGCRDSPPAEHDGFKVEVVSAY